MARLPIRPVPSSVTGELGDFLNDVRTRLNAMPIFSYFSGLTPNSTLTGRRGNFAINIGSASTDSCVWVKGGSALTTSTTGWVALRTLS